MLRHRLLASAFLAAALVLAAPALASDSLDPIEPPVVLLPNYGRVMIGSQGGLEGGALVARAKAAEAAWFNPAGVVLGVAPEIQGNASV